MLKEKDTKTSKLGLISFLCFVVTFIIVGSTDSLLSSNNGIGLWFIFGLMALSVILAIAGLAGKKQNRKDNVFSVITLVMTVGIFVLGVL